MILKVNNTGSVIAIDKQNLMEIIDRTIKLNGLNCDLNFIDTSRITEMTFLFARSEFENLHLFNGDISKWDTSNVTTMYGLFWNSEFNGDISKWDTGNVRTIENMFTSSKFSGNIDNWNISSLKNMKYDTPSAYFRRSALMHKLPKWFTDNDTKSK